MNPPCARCKKTVYPMEKLTCLDKTWHKGCFTCETCNLKLTMKTYKGYNKLPYCNTHYPTTKFTAVADTPENKRLAQQSKLQSQIEYQKEHAKELSHFTQVADNVATRQAQASARLASNIGYTTAPHETQPSTYHQPPPSQPSYQPPPQRSYQQPPQPSYQPPPQPSYQPPPQPSYQPPPPEPQPSYQPPPSQPPAPEPSREPKYVAIYDYTAADDDEVSFVEGDILVEVTVIDEGWMEGRVQRTAQYGMLPSNYVEKA